MCVGSQLFGFCSSTWLDLAVFGRLNSVHSWPLFRIQDEVGCYFPAMGTCIAVLVVD